MSSREAVRQHTKYGVAYRMMQTISEMMIDRGYQVPTGWLPATFEDFIDQYANTGPTQDTEIETVECAHSNNLLNRDKMTLICHSTGGKPTIVFFNGEHRVSAAKIKNEYHARAEAEGCGQVLIIHAGKIDVFAKRTIEELTRGNVESQLCIECFQEDEVIVNITKHELVPRHEPMSPGEVAELLRAYSLQLAMLPRILVTDPVARYFGMRRGQVMRITRKSETAGTYTTYRQVV